MSYRAAKKRDFALVALGANLPSAIGDPKTTLTRALELIGVGGGEVVAKSRWRSAAAYPPGSGPDFINAAAKVATDMDAADFLGLLHEIEAQLGRVRADRWGPRVCDLDLIAFGDMVAPDAAILETLMDLGDAAQAAPAPDTMILPHPRMHERAFVLAPLSDVAPDWRHPVLGRTVLEMLAATPAEARAEVEICDE